MAPHVILTIVYILEVLRMILRHEEIPQAFGGQMPIVNEVDIIIGLGQGLVRFRASSESERGERGWR